MGEITVIDFIAVLLIIAIFAIFFFAIAAGIAIAAVCIFKITEKIIKTIENYFNNL